MIHSLISCCGLIWCSEQIIIRTGIHTSNVTAIYFLTNTVCRSFKAAACVSRIVGPCTGVPAALKLFQDPGQWHFLVGFQISKILFLDDIKEYYEQFAYTVGGPMVQKLWAGPLVKRSTSAIKHLQVP